jgi:Raf kinase inhibitor-like YbhB/YbcL family protein
MTLTLTSSAFEAGGPIPPTYTCDGNDLSPPLAWFGLPPGTKSLALIVDDPDAPDPAAPQRTWVHWVLYNIAPDAGGLEQGTRQLPKGSREGSNDWHRTGYGGPCPPIGRHRYFFKLYALDVVLSDLAKPNKGQLLHAIEGHVLAQAELVGTYHRG